MKPIAVFALLAIAASLTGCAWSDGVAPGNPNHFAYAGEPGSFYDPSTNPPKNIGEVAYDPNQPLAVNLPAGMALPSSAAPGAVTSAPLDPAMTNRGPRPLR